MSNGSDSQDYTFQKRKESHRTNETHWTSDDWKHVEIKKSPSEMKVLSTVGVLGGKLAIEMEEPAQYPVYGDTIYLANRQIIEQLKLVDVLTAIPETKDEKKSKEKKMSKTDKIRLETSTKKTADEYKKLIASFNWKKLNIIHGLQTNRVIELRGITFMYISAFFMKQLSEYKKPKNLPQVYELIIGIGKFINLTKNYQGKSIIDPSKNELVSPTMIRDLQLWESKLKSTFNYDGSKICDINPKLFVGCDYDSYIPLAEVKPYKSQENLMENIKKSLNNGFLISYKAMTNSGKTTMVVPLALYLSNLRMTKPEFKNTQLIYSCNTQTVQFDVGCNLYNMHIKFAYAFTERDGSIAMRNHFICKRDEERVVIICSPKIAGELIKKNPNNYWLFLDEPTSGADVDVKDVHKNNFLKDNMNAIVNMPKHTILCSATNPSFDKIKPIVSDYQAKYPHADITTVYSNEIYIGCEVKTEKEEYLMPHYGATNQEELKNRLVTINKVPFLGRLYTHRVVLKLWNDLKPHIKGLPDINVIFANLDNLKMDKIRQVAISMLEMLSTQSDELIKKICSSSLIVEEKNIPVIKSIDDDDDIVFEDAQEIKENELNAKSQDLTLLGTYHAYKYLGNNVVFSDNPAGFISMAFQTLLDELKKDNITAKKIFDKYDKQLEIWQKSKSRLSSRTKDEDKKSQEMQDLTDNAPVIDMPSWAQINTLDHIKKFAKTHISEINPKLIRMKCPMESIPRTSLADDDLMLLLMCGVGIYTNDYKYVDKAYVDYVMKLASTGSLAYIVADSSLSYGANYPINRVFMAEDFCKNHSIDTVFQSISRAGRVGKSWIAQAIVPNCLALDIIKYSLNGGEDYGLVEAKNMNIMYKTLLDEKNITSSKPVTKKPALKSSLSIVREETSSSDTKEDTKEDMKESSWEDAVPISELLPRQADTKIGGLPIEQPLFTGPNKHINSNWRNKDQSKDKPSDNPLDTSRSSKATNWRDKPTQQRETKEEMKKSSKYVPPHLRRK
jgi:hypothetical protein